MLYIEKLRKTCDFQNFKIIGYTCVIQMLQLKIYFRGTPGNFLPLMHQTEKREKD